MRARSHLKIKLRVFAIVPRLFQVVLLAKCLPTFLELNWYERLGDKRKKLTARHPRDCKTGHLTSLTGRERLRNVQTMTKVCAKRATPCY